MNTSHLALEQTPPLSVPLRFFLTAPWFGLLAGLLLLDNGSSLLSHRWSLAMLALTHLITLGFISMVMFGATLQLLPVLVGSRVPQPFIVSTLLHILLTVGSLSLVGGFISEQAIWIQIAIVLLGLSFIGLIAVVGYCLLNAKGHNATIIAMRLALIALAVTIILGMGLGSLFGYGNPILFPEILTNLHLTWGLLGWVGFLVIGVAYQVVPMFQITPPYPVILTRWLTPLLFISLLLWTFSYFLTHFNATFLVISQLLAGLMGLGFSLFAIITLRLQARRLRKLPDVTLNYWRLGMLGLLSSVGLWLTGIGWPSVGTCSIYQILLGILFIAGFVLPVIQGMLYKVVPFLIWLHLQNQQLNILQVVRLVKIPNMKQIIPDRWARRQFQLYLIALGCLIGAALGPPALTYVASVSIMGSFLLLGYNLYRALWLYLSVSRQLKNQV